MLKLLINAKTNSAEANEIMPPTRFFWKILYLLLFIESGFKSEIFRIPDKFYLYLEYSEWLLK